MCNEMELGATESGVGKMMDGNKLRGESHRGWTAQAAFFILGDSSVNVCVQEPN